MKKRHIKRRDMGYKLLSLLVTAAMIFSLAAIGIPAITPTAKAAPADDYASLVERLETVRDELREKADTYGTIDFGYGYELNLVAELKDYADKIDADLAIAAGLASGQIDNQNFPVRGTGLNISNATGYNQTNFNTAVNRHAPTGGVGAAETYLKQGGFCEGDGRSYTLFGTGYYDLNWFFAYKSGLNPAYIANVNAGAGVNLGISQSGALPSGTTLADVAEGYADGLLIDIEFLTNAIEQLQGLAKEAETKTLIENLLEQDCLLGEECNCEEEVCTVLAHRLLVGEQDWYDALDKYQGDIEHDIKIIGALATGDIDADQSLLSGNTNANNYYNNSVANTTEAKLNAALSFIENGGYHNGTTSGTILVNISIQNRIYYQSRFTNYSVNFSGGLGGTGFSAEEGKDQVLSIAKFYLEMLQMGATAGSVQTIYEYRVSQVNALIKQAEDLRGSSLPAGGQYKTQDEYDDAIEAFIANAAHDLIIADFLVSGNIIRAGYATIWVETLGSLANTYASMSQDVRFGNAIRFFREGGYAYGGSFLGIGYELEYRSAFFYNEYSSGLFGIAANKANIIDIMSDTLAALKTGNPYMTPLELAKFNYEQARGKLLALQGHPEGIIAEIIENQDTFKQFVDDIADLIETLDNILTIADMLTNPDTGLGLNSDIIDIILQPFGLNREILDELRNLREMLDFGLIDPSGEANEKLEEWANTFIDGAISGAIGLSDGILTGVDLLGAGLAIPAYEFAADTFNAAYDEMMENALSGIMSLIDGILDQEIPVLGMSIRDAIEMIRPYTDLIRHTVNLLTDAITIVGDLNKLVGEFAQGETFSNLSTTTETLSYILDDLADILVDMSKTDVGWLIGLILNNEALGGFVSEGLAGGINLLAGGLLDYIGLGGDVSIVDDSQISTLLDLASSLTMGFLDNPTVLVPLMRASAEILRTVARNLGNIQLAVDGDWPGFFEAFVAEIMNIGNTFGEFGDLFEAVIGLFTDTGEIDDNTNETVAAASAAFAGLMNEEPEIAGAMATAFGFDLGALNSGAASIDPLTASFAQEIIEMTADCAHVVRDPKCSAIEKIAKINAFIKELKDCIAKMKSCAKELRDIVNAIDSAMKVGPSKLKEQQKWLIDRLLDLKGCLHKSAHAFIDCLIQHINYTCDHNGGGGTDPGTDPNGGDDDDDDDDDDVGCGCNNPDCDCGEDCDGTCECCNIDGDDDDDDDDDDVGCGCNNPDCDCGEDCDGTCECCNIDGDDDDDDDDDMSCKCIAFCSECDGCLDCNGGCGCDDCFPCECVIAIPCNCECEDCEEDCENCDCGCKCGEICDHEWGEWVTTATCTAPGTGVRTCSICGAKQYGNIKALGHIWDEGTVTSEPTKETEGEMTYKCIRCGDTYTEPIPKLTDNTGGGDNGSGDNGNGNGNNGGDNGSGSGSGSGGSGGSGGGGGYGGGGGGGAALTTIEDLETPLAGMSSYAYELYKLGLFLGIGDDEDGNPNFALELELNRRDALILTIRLLGLEEEALAYDGDCPFEDLEDWFVPYAAFAFANGITNGVSETKFGPRILVTYQQFTTFLLRALGYSEKLSDFEYEDALDFALEIGLYTMVDFFKLSASDPFLRGDAVLAMVRALLTFIKNSEEIMLLDTLVEAGLFDQEAADGFIEAIARIDEMGF